MKRWSHQPVSSRCSSGPSGASVADTSGLLSPDTSAASSFAEVTCRHNTPPENCGLTNHTLACFDCLKPRLLTTVGKSTHLVLATAGRGSFARLACGRIGFGRDVAPIRVGRRRGGLLSSSAFAIAFVTRLLFALFRLSRAAQQNLHTVDHRLAAAHFAGQLITLISLRTGTPQTANTTTQGCAEALEICPGRQDDLAGPSTPRIWGVVWSLVCTSLCSSGRISRTSFGICLFGGMPIAR